MSIDINPNCRQRLQELIATALPNILVNNGSSLDYLSSVAHLWDIDSTLSSEVRQAATEYVTERPLLDFVRCRLSTKVSKECQYDSDKPPVKLSEVGEVGDLSELAAKILDEFCSLPWSYSVTVSLPEPLGARLRELAGGDIPFSDSYKLISPTEESLEEYPLPPTSIGGFYETTKWTDTVCVRGFCSGFIDDWSETVPLESSLFQLKAFAGVGLALRLFDFQRRYGNMFQSKFAVVHLHSPDGWITQDSHSLDDDLAAGLESLVIGALDGVKGDQLVAFYKYTLLQMKGVFGYSDSQDSIDRIQLAGQWLFDSYCSKNDLLSFVQAMVSLEILLGDKRTSDLMGLGELLRNRCAYLVGKTHSQRQEILAEFKDIYEIRSDIVHSGKNKLSREERRLKSQLLWYCGRAIQEELELLVSDRRKKARVPGNA